MSKPRKNSSRNAQGFSKEFIAKTIRCLGVKPSKRYSRRDGSIVTVRKEISDRLNFIKRIFSNPENFNQSVPPAEMRDLFKKQHQAIVEALKVIRSLCEEKKTAKQSRKYDAARKWLYAVSEVDPRLSPGLIDYDVVHFDRNFLAATASLEKIEGYFSAVLAKAESSVKGPGKNKPENAYADNLLGLLCALYSDVTGEMQVSVDDANEKVRGNLVKFLEIVLRELPYPQKITPYALEIRIRRLKTHKDYAHLWKDAKR